MSALPPFSAPLVCEISNDGKIYTLINGFCYYRKGELNNEEFERAKEKGERIERLEVNVRAGFRSDGFTNFGFHSFIPKFGKGLKCAILHDYLCEHFHLGNIRRKTCDEIFLEALLETKAFPKWKCYVLYASVRIYAFLKGYK